MFFSIVEKTEKLKTNHSLNSDNFVFFAENRYKHEAMVDGEPILFEILDTCPKVCVCE